MSISDHGTKLLIIDDEPTLLLSLQAFFEDSGFNVTTVLTGEDALKLLDTTSFDAIIVDIRLPGIDGDEVILEAHRRGITTPFLIHTGSTGYQLPEEVKSLGYTQEDVFIKPIRNLEELINALEKLIIIDERVKKT